MDLGEFEVYLRQAAMPRPPMPPMTVENLLRQDPEMPREAAEYQVRRFNASRNELERMSLEFAGIASLADLAGLTPLEAMARWLEARDPAYRMRQFFKARGCDTLAVSARPSDLREHRLVLGAVEETPEKAWVVFTMSIGSGSAAGRSPMHLDTRVIPFRRSAGGWSLEWSQFIEGTLFTGGLWGLECPRRP